MVFSFFRSETKLGGGLGFEDGMVDTLPAIATSAVLNEAFQKGSAVAYRAKYQACSFQNVIRKIASHLPESFKLGYRFPSLDSSAIEDKQGKESLIRAEIHFHLVDVWTTRRITISRSVTS